MALQYRPDEQMTLYASIVRYYGGFAPAVALRPEPAPE
jgi:hypothetical protein